MTDIQELHRPMAAEVVTVPRRAVVGLRERVTVPELAAFFDRAVVAVLDEMFLQGIEPATPPVVIYRHETGPAYDVTVGFPVDEPELFTGVLDLDELPAGRVLWAEHVGPYESLPDTHAALGRWFDERQIRTPRMMWEEYLVGPDATFAPAEYRTRVFYPL
jgi:effector-binding domain-containing protein